MTYDISIEHVKMDKMWSRETPSLVRKVESKQIITL